MRKSYKQFHKAPRQHIQVWQAANGPIPPGMYIDHIGGNPLNDSLENLRLATPQQNSFNMKTPSSNKSGLKGLSWDSHRLCWRGAIRAGKQYTYRNKDMLEVCAWLFSKREELHGHFGRAR